MPRSTLAATRRSGAPTAGPGLNLPGRRSISPAYAFLLPGLAVFTLVMIVPTVQAFAISLTEWSVAPGRPSLFVGAQNYLTAVGDPVFWIALQNSGVYVVATVIPQMLLGLALAVALDRPLRGRAGFRALIYIPVISSWVVVSLLFRYLFGTDGGAVNALLAEPVDWFGGRWSAMFVIVLLGLWKGVGWAMLIFLAALQSVPAELREAAAVDGAGRLRRFWVVTIPAIRRTIVFVSILLVIGGFNVFISVKLMTDGGPSDLTQVPLTYLYRQAFNFLDFGYGSAIAFVLTVLVFALSVTQLRFTRRDDEESAA
ncbi:MAG TPA: sugar ABC transporter permease [Pseudolysinimonas sp.]|nr:sugar ABC transporter permease [Pseudolysinimonas sp.]